jgi:3-hydroxypropanoate dehydrogenase
MPAPNMEAMTSTAPESTSHRLSDDTFNALFTEARTHSAWLDRPVEDDLLHQLYELMKWGPTSANCCPVRILFLRTRKAKERLRAALQPTNIDKTMKAPVTAIIAYDSKFYETLPRLFPAMPSMKEMFAKSPELAASTAIRNGTLQGAYFILAARSLGLDCGPMSGFDNAKVDQEFFPAPVREAAAADGGFIGAGAVKSNFLCNIGYGDTARLHPRGPRLEFGEACQLL